MNCRHFWKFRCPAFAQRLRMLFAFFLSESPEYLLATNRWPKSFMTLGTRLCRHALLHKFIFSHQELRSETVFKVPVALPPKTPEVVVLEEFPAHVTRRKSCSTPLSSSGDMDQSADLFDNMDEQRSPGI